MTESTNPEVHDPADDYQVDESAGTPGDRDDVDVPLALMKDTDDGKGDDDVPPSDFQGYTDPSADQEVEN
jgi:hypothetical protein